MDWLVDCCACFLIVELLAEFDRDTGAALGPGEKLCGSKGGWLLGGARVELRGEKYTQGANTTNIKSWFRKDAATTRSTDGVPRKISFEFDKRTHTLRGVGPGRMSCWGQRPREERMSAMDSRMERPYTRQSPPVGCRIPAAAGGGGGGRGVE